MDFTKSYITASLPYIKSRQNNKKAPRLRSQAKTAELIFCLLAEFNFCKFLYILCGLIKSRRRAVYTQVVVFEAVPLAAGIVAVIIAAVSVYLFDFALCFLIAERRLKHLDVLNAIAHGCPNKHLHDIRHIAKYIVGTSAYYYARALYGKVFNYFRLIIKDVFM